MGFEIAILQCSSCESILSMVRLDESDENGLDIVPASMSLHGTICRTCESIIVFDDLKIIIVNGDEVHAKELWEMADSMGIQYEIKRPPLVQVNGDEYPNNNEVDLDKLESFHLKSITYNPAIVEQELEKLEERIFGKSLRNAIFDGYEPKLCAVLSDGTKVPTRSLFDDTAIGGDRYLRTIDDARFTIPESWQSIAFRTLNLTHSQPHLHIEKLEQAINTSQPIVRRIRSKTRRQILSLLDLAKTHQLFGICSQCYYITGFYNLPPDIPSDMTAELFGNLLVSVAAIKGPSCSHCGSTMMIVFKTEALFSGQSIVEYIKKEEEDIRKLQAFLDHRKNLTDNG